MATEKLKIDCPSALKTVQMYLGQDESPVESPGERKGVVDLAELQVDVPQVELHLMRRQHRRTSKSRCVKWSIAREALRRLSSHHLFGVLCDVAPFVEPQRRL